MPSVSDSVGHGDRHPGRSAGPGPAGRERRLGLRPDPEDDPPGVWPLSYKDCGVHLIFIFIFNTLFIV